MHLRKINISKENHKNKNGDIEKVLELTFSNDTNYKTLRLMDLSDICTGNKDLKDAEDNEKYPFYVRSANIEKINSYSYDGEAILIPGDGKFIIILMENLIIIKEFIKLVIFQMKF